MIRQLGLSAYFLAVREIVAEATRRGIEVVGRGSAVGSLVVYLLQASPVDPLEHGLMFERFLHTRRRHLPDIDLDIPSSRRDELISWIAHRYGSERVAQVAALQTFQRRAAYRDGLKALGAGERAIAKFLRALPPDDFLEGARAELPLELLPAAVRSELPLIEGLIGIPRHMSVHPGGVILADRDLADLVPLERAPKGVRVTQFDSESLQHAGLFKLDLLGNHCLDEVAEASAWLHAQEHAGGQSVRHRLMNIPVDDEAALACIDRAETIGCFQLESPAMRGVLSKLPIRSLGDVSAALALVRPGPGAGGAREMYIQRARGIVPISYWHSAFEPLLKSTFGMLLYEEDITSVLAILTGWDLARADELRSDLQRRQEDAEWLERIRWNLLTLARWRGFTTDTFDEVWRHLLLFVAYSFNKAHATSYAVLGYRAAFLKTHAPVEFGCALLNHHVGLYPKRVIGSELMRKGVALFPPSVKHSEPASTVEEQTSQRGIRVGLGRIKHLRVQTQRRLLAQRACAPFRDLADFFCRTRPNAREIQALILCGACDALEPLSIEAYPWVHEAVLSRLAHWKTNPLRQSRNTSVLEDGRNLELLRMDLKAASKLEVQGPSPRVALYRQLTRVHQELIHLEMHVSEHPMRLLRDEATHAGAVSTRELPEHIGRVVHFAAIVAATRKVPSPSGAITQFLTLEDEFGVVEAMLFPPTYALVHHHISTPGPFLIEAKVEGELTDCTLNVQQLMPFHWRRHPYS